MPALSIGKTSIRLVAFSVTTRALPLLEKPTCAGPAAALLSGRVEPASIVRSPPSRVKPVMLPLPPALRTYATAPRSVTLIGMVPPLGATSVSVRLAPFTAKVETLLLPPLTTKSQRPLSLSVTAPWLPRLPPVPVPPVATLPAGVRAPSASRVQIVTRLPAGSLVWVKTAPRGSDAAETAGAPMVAASSAAARMVTKRRIPTSCPWAGSRARRTGGMVSAPDDREVAVG